MGLWHGSRESLDTYMSSLIKPEASKYYPEWKNPINNPSVGEVLDYLKKPTMPDNQSNQTKEQIEREEDEKITEEYARRLYESACEYFDNESDWADPTRVLEKLNDCDSFNSEDIAYYLAMHANTPNDTKTKALSFIINKGYGLVRDTVMREALNSKSLSDTDKTLVARRYLVQQLDSTIDDLNKPETLLAQLDRCKSEIITKKQLLGEDPKNKNTIKVINNCELVFNFLQSKVDNHPTMAPELKELTKLLV